MESSADKQEKVGLELLSKPPVEGQEPEKKDKIQMLMLAIKAMTAMKLTK